MTSNEWDSGSIVVASEVQIFDPVSGQTVGEWTVNGFLITDPNTGHSLLLQADGSVRFTANDPDEGNPTVIDSSVDGAGSTRRKNLLLQSGDLNSHGVATLTLESATDDGSSTAYLIANAPLYATRGDGSPDTPNPVNAANGGPGFAAGWSDLGSGFGKVSYWISGDSQHVEFAGLAQYNTTHAAPVKVFTLPIGYHPNRTINLTAANSPAPGVNPTTCSIQVETNGDVFVTNYAGTTVPAPVSFENQSFALTSNV